MQFHHLGREVFLTPVTKTEDDWFRCGHDGTTDISYDVPIDTVQRRKQHWTFENTRWDTDWCFLRHPNLDNYDLRTGRAVLRGSETTLNELRSPTFLGLRQRDMTGQLTCCVSADGGEAGISVYMTEQEHYDVGIRRCDGGWECFLRLRIGEINHIQKALAPERENAELKIIFEPLYYHFYVNGVYLGKAQSKYLSTEVAGGFTGVVLGLYACGNNRAEFTDFLCRYADS